MFETVMRTRGHGLGLNVWDYMSTHLQVCLRQSRTLHRLMVAQSPPDVPVLYTEQVLDWLAYFMFVYPFRAIFFSDE